jgi:beta-lactamase regulating signal transducer with metallopeptidase domain
MNSIIDALNAWGSYAAEFAWPIFWQSSLLIAMVFAIDFTVRTKLRATVRYALWLVVLAKLVVPPSLALPTGIGWWLRSAGENAASRQAQSRVITYGSAKLPETLGHPVSVQVGAPSILSRSAWTLITYCTVAGGLLAWLVVLWWRGAVAIKQAIPAPDWLNSLSLEAAEKLGRRRAVRLFLTEHSMSPSVCGLWRPAILLPRSLTERMPPAQLRAVMLHELFHLKRGDVWISCAQTLLQIIYWWHPLLWVANARIRQLREEAVDDAVMLALRNEAEIYPDALLEVAKLAFSRPLASLGIIGILESRHKLSQRIERLVDYRKPRTAGLTIMSFIGIAAFTLIAAPMGRPPTAPVDGPPGDVVGRVSGGSVTEVMDSRSFTIQLQSPTGGKVSVPITATLPLPRGRTAMVDFTLNGASHSLVVTQDTGAPLLPLINRPISQVINAGATQSVAAPLVQARATGLNEFERPSTQIQIESQFVTVPEATMRRIWVLLGTNNSMGGTWTSNLSHKQTIAIMASLHVEGADVLSPPKIITLSGRGAMVEVSDSVGAPRINPKSLVPPGISSIEGTNGLFQSSEIESGSFLDVIPRLGADDLSVELTVSAAFTEFLGYEKKARTNVTFYVQGRKEWVEDPTRTPILRTRRMMVNAIVSNEQTLLFGGPVDENHKSAERLGDGKKRLLVFITPTIIDEKGNQRK